MKVVDLLAKALEHESMWQLMDHLTAERLKESRESLVEDRDALLRRAAEDGLPPYKKAELTDFINDIAAFDRVIEFYGGRVD